MKTEDPFAEDRAIMSREPVSDYGFVFHGWNPCAEFPHATEWEEVEDGIKFRIMVRRRKGPCEVTVKMPKLETKEGKAAFTASVRQQLVKGLETK